MSEDHLTLLFGIIFGAIGSAYIVYGRRQMEAWFFVSGFALIIYPYFVTNAFLTLLIGAVLMFLPIAKHREWI
jgi:hypothetical protein